MYDDLAFAIEALEAARYALHSRCGIRSDEDTPSGRALLKVENAIEYLSSDRESEIDSFPDDKDWQ